MHDRVNHTLVGLFVVVLGIALVAAGLWFSGDFAREEEDRYLVMPAEPMTGLSRNASVKYQGIDVGRVRELGLDEHGNVRIVISVRTNVPVQADTRVRPATQGLTGLGHLELVPGTRDAGPAVADAYRYPVLPNAPSLRTRLETAVEEGLAGVDRASERLEALLSDDNIRALNATLGNVETISDTLANNADQMEGTLDETEQLIRGMRHLVESAPETMARLDQTLASVDDAARRTATTAAQLGETGERSNAALQRLDRETLPQVNQLLLDIQGLTATLERFGHEISEHPNRLIFGAPRRSPGPGESN